MKILFDILPVVLFFATYKAAGRMPDHENIQIMWGWSMLLQITCSPGTEDQDPLRTIQPSEFFSYHLQRPPGKKQKLSQRLDKAITRVRPDQSRSPEIAPT